eukprot:1129023-Pleurochrysis_carterae.AAC.3
MHVRSGCARERVCLRARACACVLAPLLCRPSTAVISFVCECVSERACIFARAACQRVSAIASNLGATDPRSRAPQAWLPFRARRRRAAAPASTAEALAADPPASAHARATKSTFGDGPYSQLCTDGAM